MLTAVMLMAAGADAPLRLATYAYPRYDRAQAMAPMQELLAARLGRKATVTLYPSPDALRDAVRDGRVDVAVTNLSAYLAVAGERRVRAVAVLDVPAATLARYRGVLLARRGVRLAEGLRYVEVLPGSTSGALVQAGHLRGLKLTPSSFRRAPPAGTHEAALAALLTGDADIAALAEEPWRKLKAEQPARAAELTELWRSEPLPPGPVICVAAKAVPCGRIGALLRGPGGAEAAAALAAGWSETEGARAFRPVRPADYGAFRR